MEIENTFIEDLKLIHLKEFKDIRGSFIKIHNRDYFMENGLETNFKESYYSISHKNVIRGMHFQIPPAEHTKLVFVNHGAIIDVVLDIRRNSNTYGKFFSCKMSKNTTLLYIPIGCAHGFLSLEDNSIVSYFQTSVYNRECDKGIRYDSFGMDWGIVNPIVSERDLILPYFLDVIYEF